MNGLEELDKIFNVYEYSLADGYSGHLVSPDRQEELLEPIRKELKALEIIKEKGLSTNELWFIKNGKSFENYIETMEELYFGVESIEKELKTKEEYDLLKEVLK